MFSVYVDAGLVQLFSYTEKASQLNTDNLQYPLLLFSLCYANTESKFSKFDKTHRLIIILQNQISLNVFKQNDVMSF